MPQTSHSVVVPDDEPSRDRSLSTVPQERVVRIDSLHAGPVMNRRLAELGLRSGVLVEVLLNHGRDGVIVGLGGERLALPHSLAARIWIVEDSSTAEAAGGARP